jgi:glutaredoxin
MERGENMKRTLPLWPLLFLLGTAGAHAQLYKWVGPDGKVSYADTPPPPSAKQVETRPLQGSGGINTAGLPYDLSEAVKGSPVTLYTTVNCIPCDEGRKLLAERGVPFNEKTVTSNDDFAQFKKIAGDGQLPFLLVGRSKERGFEASAWNAILTSAGYPSTSKLPKAYRNPSAEALAPAPRKAASGQESLAKNEKAAGTPAPTVLPPAVGNAPPGFRF